MEIIARTASASPLDVSPYGTFMAQFDGLVGPIAASRIVYLITPNTPKEQNVKAFQKRLRLYGSRSKAQTPAIWLINEIWERRHSNWKLYHELGQGWLAKMAKMVKECPGLEHCQVFVSDNTPWNLTKWIDMAEYYKHSAIDGFAPHLFWDARQTSVKGTLKRAIAKNNPTQTRTLLQMLQQRLPKAKLALGETWTASDNAERLSSQYREILELSKDLPLEFIYFFSPTVLESYSPDQSHETAIGLCELADEEFQWRFDWSLSEF